MKLFGTDGIREKFGVSPMTQKDMIKIGAATGKVLKKHLNHIANSYNSNFIITNPTIIILRDTRHSSPLIQQALISGLCNAGVDVLVAGILPTPAAVHLIKHFNAQGALVVSASHNPSEYNGVKFFSSSGIKLSESIEQEIEQLFESNLSESIDLSSYAKHEKNSANGKAYYVHDAPEYYKFFLKNSLNTEFTSANLEPDLKGLKIAIDCANGSGYKVSSVFKELGAQTVIIGNIPDGFNINLDCGSVYPENLAKQVLSTHADFGFALDGDGDRITLVDEKGNILDGDNIIGILASNIKTKKNKIAITVMSNMGLKKFLKSKSIETVETKVGDKYVIDAMIDNDLNLGGEQSGHIILGDYAPTGDGLLVAVQIAKILKSKKLLNPDSKISKIAEISKFPQVLINIDVKEKIPFDKIKGLNEKIKEYQYSLKDSGRVLVRYSGTESLVRIMAEGESYEQIKAICEDLSRFFKKNESMSETKNEAVTETIKELNYCMKNYRINSSFIKEKK